MRYVHFAAALGLLNGFLPATHAQGVPDPTAILQQLQQKVPACALNCMLTEIPKSTCSLTDFACICTNTDLAGALLRCVAPNCTVVEQLETQRFQVTTCAAPTRNMGSTVFTITWTFFAAAIVAVTCRGIARLPQFGGSFSWDDYTIFVCLLVLVPAAVLAQMMINNGLGQDIWMLSSSQITNVLFYFYIELYFYIFLVIFTKLSILLLYLRIFTAQAFQWQCYVMIVLTVLVGLSSLLVLPVACRPINYMWNGWDGTRHAKCINMNAETFVYAALNMALDIIVFLMPVPQVIRLQMHYRKKIGVVFMFAIGGFVTVCSIVRLPTILKWGNTVNSTYDYAQLAIWSLLEMMTGVICACFPGIASLLRRCWPKVFATTKASKDSGISYNSMDRSGNVTSPRQIFSKTTVSVAFADRCPVPDSGSARSDELELTPHAGYRQHENHTRYSIDSDQRTGNNA